MMVASGAAAKGWKPKLCTTCGTPVSGADSVGTFCTPTTCREPERIRATADMRAQWRGMQDAQWQQALETAQPQIAAATEALGLTPEAVLVAEAPRFRGTLAPPDPEVRARFVAHLEEIVASAFVEGAGHRETGTLPADALDSYAWAASETEARRAEIEAEEPPEMTAACAVCRGRCCQLGHDTHAFLDRKAIDRVRARMPEADAAAVLALYLDALPERSVLKSCGYHGPVGCTLPRALRADICNAFHCNEQHRMVAALEETPRRAVTLLARNGAAPSMVATIDLDRAAREGFDAAFSIAWSVPEDR